MLLPVTLTIAISGGPILSARQPESLAPLSLASLILSGLWLMPFWMQEPLQDVRALDGKAVQRRNIQSHESPNEDRILDSIY